MRLLTALAVIGVSLGWAAVVEAGSVKGSLQLSGNRLTRPAVVYLEGVKGQFTPPKQQPEMKQVDLRFTPDMLVVLKGTTVAFPNHDTVLHSAFSLSRSNPFDLGMYAQGTPKTVTFANAGLVEVFCHLHSEMRGFVLVVDNPYFAVVRPDGSFLVPDVPAGSYTASAWAAPSRRESRRVTVGTADARVDFALRGD